MQFLYFLENLRFPAADIFFSAVTYLGDEIAFIAAVLIFFWCIDKTVGYYLAAIGFCGTMCNLTLKMMFRVPRPWELDPSFTIVESARAAATGYSFPSGHTQNAVGIWGGLALTQRNRWIRGLCLFAVVFVPISRMYLGVHTPMDVGVSIVLAVILALLLFWLYRRAEQRLSYLIFLLSPAVLLGIGALLYFSLGEFPQDAQAHLLHSMENACKLLGAAAAMLLSAIVDRQYLHFDTRAPWLGQVLKAVLGIALVLGLKAVLKLILAPILPQIPADFLRYFLTVAAAGIFWPMTFPWFAKIGKRHG